MVIRANSRTARIGPRIRLGLLLVVAVFLAHDAVYLAQFGFGDGLAIAMRDRGHDAYWPALIGLAALASILLIAATLGAIGRLRGRLEALSSDVGRITLADADPAGCPAYATEVLRLWRVLLPATLLVFALQENIEYLVAHGDVLGLEAIVGPMAPLAIPVLALVTLALSAVGGLVRWRITVLAARVARAAARGRAAALLDDTPPREWGTIHADAPHRWTLSRRDAGRAPPATLLA